jgi:hypothetical protein
MAQPVPATREALVEYLEQLSGRSIRSRAELEDYLNELKSRVPAAAPADRPARAWAAAKHAALAAGLLIAVLQYYLMDIYVQIESMQRVQFLNPDVPALQKSALEVLRFLC